MTRLLTCLWLLLAAAGCAVVGAGEPFHAADRKAVLEATMREGDLEGAADLIDRHDDVLSEQVALDVAIRAGLVDAARYFAMRTDVNSALDADGNTPLIRAVQSAPRDELDDLATMLLEAGADPRRRDNFGRDAIDYAGFGGDLALARFLESGGATEYSSDRHVRIAWLPEQDWRNIELEARRRNAADPPVLRRAPLARARDGTPLALFSSAWVPRTGPTDVGPFFGLSFHADGTGSLLHYYPLEKRLDPVDASSIAWSFRRNALHFAAVGPDFSAYCVSGVARPGRFGVDCTDYHTPSAGQASAAGSAADGATARARRLLDDETARRDLTAMGRTRAVLESAADSVCRPRQAPASVRAGLPVSAANAQRAGGWVLFDARRFRAYGPDDATVCTQRQARSAAFRSCAAGQGQCRSVGGCEPGQAVALASVEGHDWAALGCAASLDEARRRAVAACREQSGCACQVLYASADGDYETPAAGCRRR